MSRPIMASAFGRRQSKSVRPEVTTPRSKVPGDARCHVKSPLFKGMKIKEGTVQ